MLKERWLVPSRLTGQRVSRTLKWADLARLGALVLGALAYSGVLTPDQMTDIGGATAALGNALEALFAAAMVVVAGVVTLFRTLRLAIANKEG